MARRREVQNTCYVSRHSHLANLAAVNDDNSYLNHREKAP